VEFSIGMTPKSAPPRSTSSTMAGLVATGTYCAAAPKRWSAA